ncbi:MAG: CoB--CoM heterodisulfide reductase iron-sulfur subunit A family protein [Candidatus Hodarchaeota archaeon]
MSVEYKKKIGVYICWCGGNISDFVDVKAVASAAERHSNVIIGKEFMFMCSEAGQQMIENDIKDLNLDGVVVASCSPKLHELTFMNTISRAGLNSYEFYHVNIREDVSWPHSDDPEGATKKAIRAVNSGIEYVKRTEPLSKIKVMTTKRVLIIGGGIAGMRAAIDLAKMNIEVIIVEKNEFGGFVRQVYATYPAGEKGINITEKLNQKIHHLKDKIKIFSNSEVSEVSGYIGNFNIQVTSNKRILLETMVGAIIVATGFNSYEPKEGEYGYKENDNIITLSEFMELLQQNEYKTELVFKDKKIGNIGFIYCVGSRQKNMDEDILVNAYCSRYCCNATIYAALMAQKKFPNIQTYHFYDDIRSYGKQEQNYLDLRKNGAIFLKFDQENKPDITFSNDKIKISLKDILTAGENIAVPVDLLVLVTGMEARENTKIEEMIKIPKGLDKFYKESHPKLDPVQVAGRIGVLIAGTCQAPRDIAETLISSSATAAKAASIVLKGELMLEPAVAFVNPHLCNLSKMCIPECPTDAIEIKENKAWVNEALCVGCGICTAVCPTEAIQIKTLTTHQIRDMIKALVGN